MSDFKKGDQVRFRRKWDGKHRDSEDKCEVLVGDTGQIIWTGTHKSGRLEGQPKYGVSIDARQGYAAFCPGYVIELQGGPGGGGQSGAPPVSGSGRSETTGIPTPTTRVHVTKIEATDWGVILCLRLVTPEKDVEACGSAAWDAGPDPAALAYFRAKGVLTGTVHTPRSKPVEPPEDLPERDLEDDDMGELPF